MISKDLKIHFQFRIYLEMIRIKEVNIIDQIWKDWNSKVGKFREMRFKNFKNKLSENWTKRQFQRKNGQKPGNGEHSNRSIFFKIEEVKTFDERNDIEENLKKSFVIKEIILWVLLF